MHLNNSNDDNIFYILITGRSNVGKSSIMNAIIGESNILQVDHTKSTTLPIYICHNNNYHEPELCISNNKENKIIKGIENIREKIQYINDNIRNNNDNDNYYYDKDLNIYIGVDKCELKLYINIKTINFNDKYQFIFFDTPGIENNNDITSWSKSNNDMAKIADAIYYVVDICNMQNEETYRDLCSLSELNKKIYVIINKIDQHTEFKKIINSDESKIYQHILNIIKSVKEINIKEYCSLTLQSIAISVKKMKLFSNDDIEKIPNVYNSYIQLIGKTKNIFINTIEKFNKKNNKSIEIKKDQIVIISTEHFENPFANISDLFSKTNQIIENATIIKEKNNINVRNENLKRKEEEIIIKISEDFNNKSNEQKVEEFLKYNNFENKSKEQNIEEYLQDIVNAIIFDCTKLLSDLKYDEIIELRQELINITREELTCLDENQLKKYITEKLLININSNNNSLDETKLRKFIIDKHLIYITLKMKINKLEEKIYNNNLNFDEEYKKINNDIDSNESVLGNKYQKLKNKMLKIYKYYDTIKQKNISNKIKSNMFLKIEVEISKILKLSNRLCSII